MSDRHMQSFAARGRVRFASGVSRVALGVILGLGGALALPAPADAFLFWDRPSYPQYQPRQPLPPLTRNGVPLGPDGQPVKRKKRPATVKAREMDHTERNKYSDLLEKAKSGQLFITIALNDQELTLYSDGEEIARSNIASGTTGHPSPTGIFGILQKNLFHRSNIYSDAPMPYMQRITWSGVALHQGVVPGGVPASHGCIRMPDLFARQLWTVTKLGARVIVTRDPVKVVKSFSHPFLFASPSSLDATPQAQSEPAPVRVAAAATSTSDAAGGETGTQAATEGNFRTNGAQIDPRTIRKGATMVLISRKEGKIMVRKGASSVYEWPLKVDRPDEEIGTHLFTAMKPTADGKGYQWSVISMPSWEKDGPLDLRRRAAHRKGKKGKGVVEAAEPHQVLPDPAKALDRITIPDEVRERITKLMSQGSSLVITDRGLDRETDIETDFVIQTHSEAEARKFATAKPTKPKPKEPRAERDDRRGYMPPPQPRGWW